MENTNSDDSTNKENDSVSNTDCSTGETLSKVSKIDDLNTPTKTEEPAVTENNAKPDNKVESESTKSEDKSSESKPAAEQPAEEVLDEGNIVNFTVIYSKEKYEIQFSENSPIWKLKNRLETIVGVPQGLQKIMYKGLAKNEQTLKQLGISNNTKVMLVGSKLNDVLSLSTPPSGTDQASAQEEKPSKEPLCKAKIHRKILDKGVPDDVMPGILNCQEPLPPFPLSGMLNKSGGKLRITFKLELDELWLGTKERTEKIRMSSIKNVISEPIEGCEQYHIMALQLGTTEASRYWIYYVPAQYVEAIKDTILDSWS